jgi:uncharacterized protein (TIGR02996 family)
MNHDDALLHAVLASPDDDTPRLVYADWLEERGDPRAEFIRVQCALAKLAVEDGRRADLEARERVLLAQHEQEWAAPLHEAALEWRFRRGFIEYLDIHGQTFVDRAASIVRVAPGCRVRFREACYCVSALAACEYIGGLTGADFESNRLQSNHVALIATSPHVHRLTKLGLFSNDCDITAMQALASSPFLGNLRELDLRAGGVGDAGVEALASSSRRSSLTLLDLNGTNNVSPLGVRALSRIQLTVLRLHGNPIGDSGARALAGSIHMRVLRELQLGNCGISDAGGRALAESPYLRHLTMLDLADIGEPWDNDDPKNTISRSVMNALRARFGERVRFLAVEA